MNFPVFIFLGYSFIINLEIYALQIIVETSTHVNR